MARPRKLVPDLYFHKSSAQYRVTLPGGGNKYFGHAEGPAREKYHAWAALWIARQGGTLASPASLRGQAVSMGEAIKCYTTHASTYYPREQMARVEQAMRALAECFPDILAADFDAPHLKDVRAYLLTREARCWKRKPDEQLKTPRRRQEPKRQPAKLSRSYVNSLVGHIQTAWTWLESEGLVPRGSAEHLRTVTQIREGHGGVETAPVLPVAEDVVEATLLLLGPVVADMVRLQRLTGARPGEICRLTPERVSRDPATAVRVELPGGKYFDATAQDVGGVMVWVYAPAEHKTRKRGKLKLIAIGPKAQQILLPYLAGRAPDAPVFSPRETVALFRARQRRERKSPVQPSQECRKKKKPRRSPGTRYTSRSYAYAIRRCCEKHGIPPWAPNQLRHARLGVVRDEYDTDEAQAVAGHSRPDMTSLYAKQSLAKAAHVAAEIG